MAFVLLLLGNLLPCVSCFSVTTSNRSKLGLLAECPDNPDKTIQTITEETTFTDCTWEGFLQGVFSIKGEDSLVQVTIQSCTFSGCYGESGGVFAVANYGKLQLIGCSITNCGGSYYGGVLYQDGEFDPSTVVQDCKFEKCSSDVMAGGFHVACGALSVTDSSFIEMTCEGDEGSMVSAINLAASAIGSITDCIFQECRSNLGYGTICCSSATSTICRCVFESCTVSVHCAGIMVQSECPTIKDVVFINLDASYGACLQFWTSDGSKPAIIDNCTCIGCGAEAGGAVHVSASYPVTIQNSRFEECNGESGGVICIIDSVVVLDGCEASACSGGLIWCQYNDNQDMVITVANCVIDGCHDATGTWIYCYFGKAYLNMCTVKNCYGGYLITGWDVDVEAHSVNFVSCSGDDLIQYVRNIDIEACLFEKCVSQRSGVIISNNDAQNTVCSVFNTSFIECECENGPIVYRGSANTNAVFKYVTIKGCRAADCIFYIAEDAEVNGSELVIEDCYAGMGLFQTDVGKVDLTSVSIKKCSGYWSSVAYIELGGGSIAAHGVTIVDCYATYGGVVYSAGTNPGYIRFDTGCSIESCSGEYGLIVASNDWVTIEFTKISHCWTDTEILNAPGTTLELTNVTFDSNIGSVKVIDCPSESKIYGCSFTHCSSSDDIFYIQNSNVLIESSVFLNCSGYLSGAINVGENSIVTAKDVVIDACYSRESGGVVYINSADTSVTFDSNCHIRDCSSEVAFSVFYVGQGCTLTVKQTHISGCSLTAYGAVAYSVGGVEFDECTINQCSGSNELFYAQRSFVLKGTSVTSCSSTSQTNAIIMIYGGSCTIDQCKFSDCTSSGPGIVDSSHSAQSVTITRTEIFDCHSVQGTVLTTTETPCTISECLIHDVSSMSNGIIVVKNVGALLVEKCAIWNINNTNTHSTESIGVFEVRAASTITVTDTNISNGVYACSTFFVVGSAQAKLVRVRVENISADIGGVISQGGSTTADIQNCFFRNVTAADGACAYVGSTSSLGFSMTDTYVCDCSSQKSGVLWLSLAAEIIRSTFVNCDGGFVTSASGSLVIDESTIEECSPISNPTRGALCTTDSTESKGDISISNSKIKNCRAASGSYNFVSFTRTQDTFSLETVVIEGCSPSCIYVSAHGFSMDNTVIRG